jgi:hypothetical protein
MCFQSKKGSGLIKILYVCTIRYSILHFNFMHPPIIKLFLRIVFFKFFNQLVLHRLLHKIYIVLDYCR